MPHLILLFRIFALLILTLSGQFVYCQNSDYSTEKNEINIYNQALQAYLLHFEKQPDSIYLEEDYKITDDILNQVGRTKIIVVKSTQLKHLLKRKNIILYRIFPLSFREKLFYVSFVPFLVSNQKRQNNTNFVNPGGSEVIFKYAN